MGTVAYRALLCFGLAVVGAGLANSERWWLIILWAAGGGTLTAFLSVNREATK